MSTSPQPPNMKPARWREECEGDHIERHEDEVKTAVVTPEKIQSTFSVALLSCTRARGHDSILAFQGSKGEHIYRLSFNPLGTVISDHVLDPLGFLRGGEHVEA